MEGILRGILLVVFITCIIFISYTLRHILKFYKETKNRGAAIIMDKLYLFGTAAMGIVFLGYFFCAVTEYINLIAENQSIKPIMYYGFVFGILFISIDNLLQQGLVAISRECFIIYGKTFRLSTLSITNSKKYLFRITVDVASDDKQYRIRLSEDNYTRIMSKLI